MNDILQQKMRRIREIQSSQPALKEILDFYAEIVSAREDTKGIIRRKLDPLETNAEIIRVCLQEGFPVLGKKLISQSLHLLRSYLNRLLELIRPRNPKAVSAIQAEIQNRTATIAAWAERIWNKTDTESESGLKDFLIIETLKPMLEIYSAQLKDQIRSPLWTQGYCPGCGGSPLMGELRGEEGKKFLSCSLCSAEWEFARIRCPFCGNDDQRQWSYFTVENDDRYRVDLCHRCKKYLKTVDSRKFVEKALLDVEDIATLHLDVLAQQEGYFPGHPHLLSVSSL